MNSPAKRLSFTSSATIKIRIGTSSAFNIHEDILTRESEWFRNTLANPLSNEHKTKEFHLSPVDGHDQSAFAILADWLYLGPSVLEKVANTRPTTGYKANRLAQENLTKVYIQADRVGVSKLKNQIVDVILAFSQHTLPSFYALKSVKDAVPHSPLESYFLDCAAYWLHQVPRFLEYNPNDWHVGTKVMDLDPELARRVLVKLCLLNAQGRAYNPTDTTGCTYHFHDRVAPAAECLKVGTGNAGDEEEDEDESLD